MIKIFLGFDQREAVSYHVCSQSIIEKASEPITICPLPAVVESDGSNAFTLSRYLIPHLCDYQGWAVFIDGDMVVDADITRLLDYKDCAKAVSVVRHDYKTKSPIKYRGSTLESPNANYPRKNWSSVVLWNCEHPSNRILTPEYVKATSSLVLHRFGWLAEGDIGALIENWNYLVGEDPPSSANIYHYTLGIPGIKHYANDHASWKWHRALLRSLECGGEQAVSMVQRADEAIGHP